MQDWKPAASMAAIEAAAAPRSERRRWAGQNEWDKDNMETVSTRVTKAAAERIKRACRQAGVTRYALVAHLLREWLETWEALEGGEGK